jgi:hypothetical protein
MMKNAKTRTSQNMTDKILEIYRKVFGEEEASELTDDEIDNLRVRFAFENYNTAKLKRYLTRLREIRKGQPQPREQTSSFATEYAGIDTSYGISDGLPEEPHGPVDEDDLTRRKDALGELRDIRNADLMRNACVRQGETDIPVYQIGDAR